MFAWWVSEKSVTSVSLVIAETVGGGVVLQGDQAGRGPPDLADPHPVAGQRIAEMLELAAEGHRRVRPELRRLPDLVGLGGLVQPLKQVRGVPLPAPHLPGEQEECQGQRVVEGSAFLAGFGLGKSFVTCDII